MCYSASAHCKLVCGHSFCYQCVKQWYHRGAEQNCPMCRAPIYFKGLYKKQGEWAEEAYETKVSEVFNEYFNLVLEDGVEYAKDFAKIFHSSYQKEIEKGCLNEVMSDLKFLEKTHRYLRHEQVDHEEIEEVYYYGDYYSDRVLNSKNQYRERPRSPPPPRHMHRRNSHKVMLHSRGRR